MCGVALQWSILPLCVLIALPGCRVAGLPSPAEGGDGKYLRSSGTANSLNESVPFDRLSAPLTDGSRTSAYSHHRQSGAGDEVPSWFIWRGGTIVAR